MSPEGSIPGLLTGSGLADAPVDTRRNQQRDYAVQTVEKLHRIDVLGSEECGPATVHSEMVPTFARSVEFITCKTQRARNSSWKAAKFCSPTGVHCHAATCAHLR